MKEFNKSTRSVKNNDKQLHNDGDKENMPPLSPRVIQSPFFSNVSLRGDKENCTPLSTTDIVSTFAFDVSNPGSVKRQYKPRTNALISEYVRNKNPNNLLCHDKEVTNSEAEPPPKRKYKPRQKKDSSCDQEVRAQVKRKYTPRAKVVQTDGFPASSDCRTPLGNMTNVLNSDSHNHIPSFSSTITNNEDVVVTTSKRINQTKFSFPESSRSLFSDKNHRGNLNESEIDYEVIEHSVILNEESDEELFVEDECDLADDMNSDFLDDGLESNVHHIPEEYATLGAPTCICLYCGAYMWKEERVNKNVIHGTPMFSLCCGRGQICLPKALPAPTYLQNLYNDAEKGPAFLNLIRVYNSMFSFTSIGGNVDHSLNNGGGPYVYCLNGVNHHVFGSILPLPGDHPKFSQLYIYDTTNEVANRMRWRTAGTGDEVDVEVVQGLMDMLDESNELVKKFRRTRDRYEVGEVVDLQVELKSSRAANGRENHVGPSDEVAGLMVGDAEETCGSCDIIVDDRVLGLVRVPTIHPKLMALQYPLLFPNGEDGYHADISFVDRDNNGTKKRTKVSMREFYSYMLQVRAYESYTLRLGGRLFQQYVVDASSCIEQARLWWFRDHQTTIRNELYKNICDSIRRGDADSANVGKSTILPAGFVGSKRYMQQNFQDALVVCRYVGHPDIFLTMTCNPLWDEITKMMDLVPGCLSQNCPDIISRVFHLKLQQLTDDIKKKSYFGVCVGLMYVVEFQKRGLPHVHMLIWLDSNSKKNLIANVDKFVSAEIPDPVEDPVGYEAVKAFMIHGPCGAERMKSPCMKDFKCIRHFPKKYCARTTYDECGFPIYKRRNTGITVKVRNSVLNNQNVVPYNRNLLVKYQCHMNVEICCHARSIKYLFKYCLKGHDRATIHIRGRKKNTQTEDKDVVVDEISEFLDGRYICGAEASYRIFGFDIHYRSVSVERLSFHLPNAKNCSFRANENLSKVADRSRWRPSKLEAFFQLNLRDNNARQYTYDEIPRFYVWNDTDCRWTSRKKGMQIGRISYTHHSSGKAWYLRLLLLTVRGPTSFEHLKTVNGIQYNTFREACKEYGLLDDDSEWHEVLSQCASCGFPTQIRQLFVHVMVNCKVTDLKKLWESHWTNMVDDILYKRRSLTGNPNLILNEKQLQYYALAEIHSLLSSIGKSLKDFQELPQPPSRYIEVDTNSLLVEETSYNIEEMAKEHKLLLEKCNKEQSEVYKAVMDTVNKKEGGTFFVYGSGGCGKTYLWKTLICKLRSEGKVVLPVASSGIAATLMPGGRTAHSRFKIPIVLDDYSMCNIGHNSDIAELIKHTSLIIWDEAPMQHRYAFECLDRSLRDIMKSVHPDRYHRPFGGITVLLGGDFRQILPVINRGDRSQIMSACLTSSRLWHLFKIFELRQNMRLCKGSNEMEVQKLKEFSQWVLNIGNGKVPKPSDGMFEYNEDDIQIPEEYCNFQNNHSIDNMISNVYPDMIENLNNPDYWSERAILTPVNQTVSHLNSQIVDQIPGEYFSYFSVDTAEDFGGTEADLNSAFPTEYLNSLNMSGLPSHELRLKVGVVVMLTRNLNQTLGLCNGTRMIVTKCLKNCVQCEVICGTYVGTRHFIPRMELSPTDTRLPFKLVRKQLSIQICYAMTINKSQGQSLKVVGLFLPKPVFTHGQLYVALSRVTSPEGLKIFIDSTNGEGTNITQNIVYKEVFYKLPTV